MRAASIIVVSIALAGACSDPRVSEDRDAACANHIDDDGDGLVDCDDPDCAGTRACEKTTETCDNDIDDDRNGTLDCRQDSCRVLPVCKDAVPTPSCLLLPPGSVTGCPRGKGCYLADNRRWCALEGASLAGGACGDDPSDRAQGCAAGYQCGTDKRCSRICVDDYDCTRNSVCVRDGQIGTCTLSCLRSSDCRAGEACAPLQRDASLLEEGGWAHRCVPQSEVAEGTATEGQDCVEPAGTRGGADVCALGFLCMPEIGAKHCRQVCRGSTDGTPVIGGCPSGKLCYAVVPFSGQASSFEERYAIGVCL